MSQSTENLYDQDFSLWLQRQAQLLRERRFDELDLDNLVEEIASVERTEVRRIATAVRTIIEHTWLLRAVPDAKERWDWEVEITHHRIAIEETVEMSPSLKVKIKPMVDLQWDRAAKLAAVRLTALGYSGADSAHEHVISLRDLFGSFANEL